jgi:hypothetical protein
MTPKIEKVVGDFEETGVEDGNAYATAQAILESASTWPEGPDHAGAACEPPHHLPSHPAPTSGVEQEGNQMQTFTVTVTLYGNTHKWTGLSEAAAKRLLQEAGFKKDATTTIEKE